MQTLGDIEDRDAFQPALTGASRTALPFFDVYFDPFDKAPVDTFYWATPGRAIKKFHRDGSPICALGAFHADARFYGSVPASAFEGMAAQGFQQGHAVPAEAMMFDRSALADTFGTPNMWAQRRILNQGVMKRLESLIFKAQTREKLGVHTGRIFDFTKGKDRLPSGVAIPDAFFKVVFSPARQRVACYIIANSDNVESSIDLHYVPLARVCALSGLIFPALSGYKDDPGLLYPQPELLKLDLGGNPICLEDLENGEYVLTQDLICNPCDKEFPKARIRIKAGFATDGGSVPKIAWNVFPPIGTFRDRSFLLHDALYASNYYQAGFESMPLRHDMRYLTESYLTHVGTTLDLRLDRGVWTPYKIIEDSSACRAECDWRLLESLAAVGDSWAARNTIWSAVKVGGGSVWAAHTPEGVAAARTLVETLEVR